MGLIPIPNLNINTTQQPKSAVAASPVTVSFGSVIYGGSGGITNSSGALPTPASTLASGITGAVTGSSSSELILLVAALGFLILVLTHKKR
jgi:hypothetical protein